MSSSMPSSSASLEYQQAKSEGSRQTEGVRQVPAVQKSLAKIPVSTVYKNDTLTVTCAGNYHPKTLEYCG